MDYDELLLDVKRSFTAIENDFDLALHDLHVRLARLDLLTRPAVPLELSPEDTVVSALAVPREVYGPIVNPYADPVIPSHVELHASLPWWRRVLRRLDRRFARDLEVST